MKKVSFEGESKAMVSNRYCALTGSVARRHMRREQAGEQREEGREEGIWRVHRPVVATVATIGEGSLVGHRVSVSPSAVRVVSR